MLEVTIFLSFAFSTREVFECDTEYAVDQNLDMWDYSLCVQIASLSFLRQKLREKKLIKETAEKKSLDRHITAMAVTELVKGTESSQSFRSLSVNEKRKCNYKVPKIDDLWNFFLWKNLVTVLRLLVFLWFFKTFS